MVHHPAREAVPALVRAPSLPPRPALPSPPSPLLTVLLCPLGSVCQHAVGLRLCLFPETGFPAVFLVPALRARLWWQVLRPSPLAASPIRCRFPNKLFFPSQAFSFLKAKTTTYLLLLPQHTPGAGKTQYIFT